MAHIRFTIEVHCEDQEPSRIIPAIDGAIFEYMGETDEEMKVGDIHAYLVLTGRAVNESESLLDAMDSVSAPVMECYEALFDVETDEWNQAVEETYHGEITESDVLFIESIKTGCALSGKRNRCACRARNYSDLRVQLRTRSLQTFSSPILQLAR